MPVYLINVNATSMIAEYIEEPTRVTGVLWCEGDGLRIFVAKNGNSVTAKNGRKGALDQLCISIAQNEGRLISALTWHMDRPAPQKRAPKHVRQSRQYMRHMFDND